MAITIGSNISSLTAQRALDGATRARSNVFERLSSGLRINRASDDAAGLAVASGLNSNVRVYNTALRNLSDGISYLNIADAAVQNTKAVLFRLKELATQSANGTYSDVQRRALDGEAQSLIKEYNRILETTTFNKQQIFGGATRTSELSIQHGYGKEEALKIEFGSNVTSTTTQTVGTGTFQARISLVGSTGADTVAAGDIDGDGDIDFVGSAYFSNSLDVLRNNGNGTFAARVSYSEPGFPLTPSFISLADVNGDQRLDMIYKFGEELSAGDSIKIRLNNGDGTFGNSIGLATGATNPYDTAVGDFNGDTFADILAVDEAGTTVWYYQSNGNGTFAAGVSMTTGTDASAVTVGDLNGDNALDFIVHSADDRISVHLGNGNGTFQTRVSYVTNANSSTGSSGRTIKLADADEDGDLDIFALNNTSLTFDLHRNNGNGTFAAGTSFSVPNATPSALTVGDLNGDGFVDVVYSTFGNDRTHVRLGNGNGTFAAAVSMTTGDEPFDLTLADFNGDGALDILSASQGDGRYNINFANTTTAQSTSTTFTGLRTLSGISVATRANALAALATVDTYFEELNRVGGIFGASMARVELITNKLGVQVEKLRAAASGIMDADIAVESAEAVRLEILQRSAASILASANQLPTLALDLLRA